MSLTSLVAAARSAVHLSELAATAAEEATEAAKLASIHAKAALAAAELALDIEQNIKSKSDVQPNTEHLGSGSFTHNTEGHNDNEAENINFCLESISQTEAISSKEYKVQENAAPGNEDRITYDSTKTFGDSE